MPASGQALAMLEMPLAARETFGDNLVGREAQAVAGFFRNRAKCAILTVTTAEPLAVAETVENSRKLEAMDLPNQAIVHNRLSLTRFAASDLEDLKQSETGLEDIDDLFYPARAELNRRHREQRAAGILTRMIGTPLVSIPDVPNVSGLLLIRQLADHLLSA
jgi:hypothetical protein